MQYRIKHSYANKNPTYIFDKPEYKFYQLSNIYPSPITVDGVVFKTAQHYYQWKRFNDPITKNRILKAETANLAKQIASDNEHLAISIDDYQVMKDGVTEKFTQNPWLVGILKSTGDGYIIYHTIEDDIWGNNGDNTGMNLLGLILTDLRSIF